MRGGEGDGNSVGNYQFIFTDNAYIHKVRLNSLCGMDGRKPFPATIRQGYAKAYRMVCKEVHAGVI